MRFFFFLGLVAIRTKEGREKCLFFKEILPHFALFSDAPETPERCAMPNFVDPEFFRLHSEKKICVRIRTKKWLKIIITCPRLHKNRGGEKHLFPQFTTLNLWPPKNIEDDPRIMQKTLDGLVQQGSTTSFNHKREYGSIKKAGEFFKKKSIFQDRQPHQKDLESFFFLFLFEYSFIFFKVFYE